MNPPSGPGISLIQLRSVRVEWVIMTGAIENIVASYVYPQNRATLREIREHRQRLLNGSRMHNGSWSAWKT